MTRTRTQDRIFSPVGVFTSDTAGFVLAAILLLTTTSAHAFDSGSTGADGALAPTVSTELALPADGVFNFTTVDIPDGVTVTFAKNATNTPVVLLASGDANIAGSILVSGASAPNVGAAGDGVLGDDGLPGEGGPGGYGGGSGGAPKGDFLGGDGQGPGAGVRGVDYIGYRQNGGGGSFGTSASSHQYNGAPGEVYGSSLLLPLIGGSGGGGGMGGNVFAGSGGGGGGGALLIASSGTINITGAVRADGSSAGASAGADCGGVGGSGSGGGIRLVATTIAGDGAITANGGASAIIGSCATTGYYTSNRVARGGAGRIRLEAETMQRTAASSPAHSFGPPGDLYVVGLPSLRITRVAGVDAPASPTGVADIQLPTDTPNPVAVEFEATGIPLGNIVALTVTPAFGASVSTVSDALAGDSALSTASATIDLPQGPSTLLASITYTLVAGLGADLSRFAGEPVEAIRVEAAFGGGTRYLLITASGREVLVAPAQLAAAG